MFFSLQYHVIRSESGVRVLPRTPQHSLASTWADVRTWTPSQWTDRLDLARAALAAGATDLIADSIRIPLQDEVSESATTLDELRGFLNRTREEVRDRVDKSVQAVQPSRLAAVTDSLRPLALANRDTEDRLDLDHEEPEASDSTLIPLPAEARSLALNTPPADPFRTPQASADPTDSLSPRAPRLPSRFTDAEVREGLNDGKATASSAAAVAARLLQEAEDVERQIFGDVSGKRPATPRLRSAAPNRAAAELEQSARELLEQVQRAANGQPLSTPAAGTTTSDTATADTAEQPYIRNPAGSETPTSTTPADTPEPEPGLGFDPFLEAESESDP
jgi:hypothetical protein